MNTKKFRPGDRVQHRNGGPVMQVLHYILEHNPWVGNCISDDQVDCVWHENEQRKSKVFRQDVLTNVSVPSGLVLTGAGISPGLQQ